MVAAVPNAREARELLRANVARRARELAEAPGSSDATGPDGEGDAIEAFVSRYYAQVVIDEVLLADTDHLARAALAHWRLGAQRPPSTAIVSLRTPTTS